MMNSNNDCEAIAYDLEKTREENSRIQVATLGERFAEIGLSPA